MIDDLMIFDRQSSSRSSISNHRSPIEFAWFLARLLDEAVHVPGTRIPIGLDPLIGAQLGLPRIVLTRMGLNLLLNAAVGGIPGLGDLFSFWYRSNLRNAALI